MTMTTPRARLTLGSLHPSTLAPTADNRVVVGNLAALVERQLEDDRRVLSQLKGSGDARALAMARSNRDESLQYYVVLNDWITQYGIHHQQSQTNGGASSSSSSSTTTAAAARQQQPPNLIVVAPPPITPPVSSIPVSIPDVIWNIGRIGNFFNERGTTVECLVDDATRVHYVTLRTLRRSIYGEVRLSQVGRLAQGNMVALSEPPQLIAVKMFEKELVRTRRTRDGHSVEENPLLELKIQAHLSRGSHPNILPLMGCLQTSTDLFAVYPFVGGGELFDFVSGRSPLGEPLTRRIFRGMLEGVHYCHAMRVSHRDVSLENFLMRTDRDEEVDAQTALLIDFGLSSQMPPVGNNMIPKTRAVGKWFYMSPEMFDDGVRQYDGVKTDSWSLGICLLMMILGFPLWKLPSSTDKYYRAGWVVDFFSWARANT